MITEEQILALNPHVDLDQLERARELLEQLRARGIRRKDYELALPFSERRAAVRDDANCAAHLVQLRGDPLVQTDG